jgi:predicted oxidoreductase
MDARVIGVDGKPIARLYSAGELGSIYSFLY